MTRRSVFRCLFYLLTTANICLLFSAFIINQALEPGQREILIMLPLFSFGGLIVAMIQVIAVLEEQPVLDPWQRNVVIFLGIASAIGVAVTFMLGTWTD
jgi:hypothetical protein